MADVVGRVGVCRGLCRPLPARGVRAFQTQASELITMPRARAPFFAGLLLAVGLGLVTWLEPWYQSWSGSRTGSANLLSVALGDSRRLFAKHFYAKADAYFHSGYYPSIFDQRPDEDKLHMAA